MPDVLLADDDALTRLTLRAAVEHLGCSVVDAADGDECLERLQTDRFMLVMMDAQMPGALLATRLDAARAVPEVPQIAVLTGATDSTTAALLHRGDRLLQKPVTLAELRELLATASARAAGEAGGGADGAR